MPAYGLRVFLGDAAGAHSVVPGGLHLCLHVGDDLLGFTAIEQKAGVLRENIVRIGVAPLIAAIEGEVAALQTDLR